LRATVRLSLVVLLLLHACTDPTVPRIEGPPLVLVGQWSSVRPAPIVQVHLHLLPTGKVLSWGRTGDPRVWDPATGAFTPVPAPSLLFCAGHDFLPDGRLLVAGGHISDLHGLANTNVFDPVAGVWQVEPAMAAGRWYPTNTTLPNGEVLTLAGTDEAGANVTIPETGRWTTLARNAVIRIYHQTSLLLPDGQVLNTGSGGAPSIGAVDELNYELYSPPYLFNGPRPTITGATPAAVAYGQTLVVTTPGGAAVTKVTLIRCRFSVPPNDYLASTAVPPRFGRDL